MSAPPVPTSENRFDPPITERQEVTCRRRHWLVAGLLGCADLPQAQKGLGRKLASFNKDITSHGGWVVKGIAGKAEIFANLPSATKPLTKT